MGYSEFQLGSARESDYLAVMPWQRWRPGPDAMIFAALSCGAFAYISSWPQLFGVSDEAHFLYHSREILAGKVPYRDFFEFYTPLSFYLMATAFALFGAKLATAKIFMALVHALTVGLIFSTGLRVGARHSLAVAAAILYLVMGPAAWPYASPHWIAACLLVALLYVLTARSLDKKSLVWLGLLTGLLTSTQQQVGVPIAMGIGLSLVATSFLDERQGQGGAIPNAANKLYVFGVSAVGLTLCVLLLVMVSAGPIPIFEQLVVHPLTGYRDNLSSSWGGVGPLAQWLAPYTVPKVLRLLAPSLLAISCFRLLLAFRSGQPKALRALSAQTIYLFFSICAVLYFPDFVHLAFISSVVLVVSAETMEWALARLETKVSLPNFGPFIGLFVTGLAIAQLWTNLEDLNSQFHIEQETEFGRVHFEFDEDRQLFLDVRAELDKSQDRELFCYPVYASLYLTAGAHNPTKHVLMFPKYLSAATYDEVLRTLDAEQVRNIVLFSDFLDLKSDPMYAYVQRNYHCANSRKSCTLYRRNE